MEPAAAEIDREAARLDAPGPSAEPVARFDDQAIDAGIVQAPRSADPCRAAADDRDLDFALRHPDCPFAPNAPASE